MKKRYEVPEMEIILFETEDILMQSNLLPGDGDGDGEGDDW